MDLDPQPRPTQGIRRACPHLTQRADRRGRCRTQARRAVLAPAQQGGGLRVRASIANPAEDPSPGTPRRRRRCRAVTAGSPSARRAAGARPSASCNIGPSSPTGAWLMTGAQQHRRVERVRHRGAHPTSPRRAKLRGRPQAPDACASLRQSPALPQNHPTTKHSTRRRRSTRPPAPRSRHRTSQRSFANL